MKLEDLKPGDVVLRWKQSPMVFESWYESAHTPEPRTIFRCLETWEIYSCLGSDFAKDFAHRGWQLLERSSQVGHSGSVNSDGGEENLDHGESAMNQILTSDATPETATSTEAAAEPKAKKTRTVDYTRTDKRPHSFRYKRHSTFVARSGAVNLSKDADGAFVIGPAPEGSTADAGQLTAGQLELVSVKKRPNGKTAIAFTHPELGTVVAYDARAARAALRAG